MRKKIISMLIIFAFLMSAMVIAYKVTPVHAQYSADIDAWTDSEDTHYHDSSSAGSFDRWAYTLPYGDPNPSPYESDVVHTVSTYHVPLGLYFGTVFQAKLIMYVEVWQGGNKVDYSGSYPSGNWIDTQTWNIWGYGDCDLTVDNFDNSGCNYHDMDWTSIHYGLSETTYNGYTFKVWYFIYWYKDYYTQVGLSNQVCFDHDEYSNPDNYMLDYYSRSQYADSITWQEAYKDAQISYDDCSLGSQRDGYGAFLLAYSEGSLARQAYTIGGGAPLFFEPDTTLASGDIYVFGTAFISNSPVYVYARAAYNHEWNLVGEQEWDYTTASWHYFGNVANVDQFMVIAYCPSNYQYSEIWVDCVKCVQYSQYLDFWYPPM